MRRTSIAVLALVSVIAGCAPYQSVGISEYKDYPAKRNTILTDAMRCFGALALLYRRPSPAVEEKLVRFAVPEVLDATGYSRIDDNTLEIPADMTAMALTEASRIGGVFRLIHVPTQREFQNFFPATITAQYPGAFSTGYYTTGTSLLYGTLTEYDRILKNNRLDTTLGVNFGKGRGDTDIGAEYDAVYNVGRMTMDFRLVSASSGEVVNNVSSSNTALLRQRSRTAGVSVSIDGNTASVVDFRSEVDARHAAIRILIQHGMVETFGKRLRIPYWKCISSEIDGSDKRVIDHRLREKWNYEEVLSGEGKKGVMRQATRDTYKDVLLAKFTVRNENGQLVDFSEKIVEDASSLSCDEIMKGKDPTKVGCRVTGGTIRSQFALLQELAELYNHVTRRHSDDPELIIQTNLQRNPESIAYFLRSLRNTLASTAMPELAIEGLPLDEIYAKLWLGLADLEAHYAKL